MKLGKTFYARNRKEWRSWLARHGTRAKEIWLVYYNQASGRPRIPYNDAVEEALCYGWIDSTVKKIDAHSSAQRFTPRRPGSPLSQMNLERVRRLIRARRMTKAGLATVLGRLRERFVPPPDILRALKRDPETWNNFQSFPKSYQRIRIAFVAGARRRPKVFRTRLQYLLRMTKRAKMFGMVK